MPSPASIPGKPERAYCGKLASNKLQKKELVQYTLDADAVASVKLSAVVSSQEKLESSLVV